MKKIIPSLSKIWLKVTNLEQTLFPQLQEMLGDLSTKEQKLIKILDFAQIEKNITVVNITNTPKDRIEMARSFIAKSVYNLQTTRDLIDRLKVDKTLRVLCGWRYSNEIPSESKFSRFFKELSDLKIAQKTHKQFVEEYLSDEIFFYNSSDSTKIPLRQKAVKKEKINKPKKKRGRPRKGETPIPKEPTILEKQKNMQTTNEMLELISTDCGVGIKQNSQGNREVWIGGKLHLSVVDGDIPITAIYSGANVHDSSVSLPLIQETSSKVTYLYDLQDAAYDCDIIKFFSKQNNHRAIIDINPKNSKKSKEKLELEKREIEMHKRLKIHTPSYEHHYNQRSSVERVNAYLKDNFGCNKIYYQGASKVASVLAFGVLSVCIHQALKLVT
ncbi:transposase [Poseidonibacter ostreae]|uniref:Transposase n=1 Tax=Poseidonibacter ostreae TaxID=2654171 RepID=A0A6L4WN25_9BACT|nr:transposase [Poseidonibacter ostreae]KAB7880567.1 transposase [Poseidonibacter ostreae]KAB7882968.1 transposase [Poseidonibacter ostreae]